MSLKVIVWIRGLIEENTHMGKPELSVLYGLYKHGYVDWYNVTVGVTYSKVSEICVNTPILYFSEAYFLF